MLSDQPRAEAEFAELNSTPGMSASRVYDDYSEWATTLTGPADTPYAGGVFKLSVQIPPGHPERPPQVYFVTKIYHPNISASGIQLPVLEDQWAPKMSVKSVFERVLELLKSPKTEGALVPDVAAELEKDKAAFEKTAREWTESFAKVA